jgi:uncharacterized membrane protein YhaH (DUF805 family)
MAFGKKPPQKHRFDPRDDWRDLLFYTRGRIGRFTFVWVFALVAVAWLAVGFAVETFGPGDPTQQLVAWTLATLPLSWMAGAVSAKRLQDLGLTPWIALTLLLPGIRWVFALGIGAVPGEGAWNKYGWPPK